MTTPTPAALAWQEERDRLIGIAYRMLGDLGHAEDVVSEVAIEAVRAERDLEPIRSWPAWLTTVCVRRSLDRIRREAAIREEYPGPWLPEPVSTDVLPDEAIANRELLSLALLHLAEQLTPVARTALVLHRAFGMSAVDIAPMLDRTPAAVRQLISRAERRLRIDPEVAAPRADRAALERLVVAIERGEIERVAALIDDDAILWSDGGGRVRSALNPIFGVERIVRFLVGVIDGARAAGEKMRIGLVEVNGETALTFRRPERLDVVCVELDFSGRIRGIRQVSNPVKLTRAGMV